MYKKIFALMCFLILLTGSFLYSKKKIQEPQKTKLRILSVYVRNLSIQHIGLEKFAEIVKDISGGQLEIEIYAAKEYQNIEPMKVFEAVSNGTVEMGFGTSPYWELDKISGSQFMFAVPFGLSAKDMYAWLYWGGGLELLREMYKPYNVIPFPVGNFGGAMGGWFKNEIKSTDDFKVMKIRTFGFDAKVYEKLGATTKWIIATDILDAYNKGEINAFIYQGPYDDLNYKFYRGPKYYYYPGWQEPGGVISLIINKNFWDGLPGNIKKAIELACSNTYQYISNQFDIMNSTYLKELRREEGLKILKFPDEVLDEFRKITMELLKEESDKNSQFAKIYQSFKKFKEENVYSEWNKILDMAVYYNIKPDNTTASKFIEGLRDSRVASVTQKGDNSVVITFSGFTSWEFKTNPTLSEGIAHIAKIIRDNSISIRSIRVEGHAATDGDDSSNWKVSKERANTVANLLKVNGIAKSLLKVIAFGKDYPIIVPDDTEEKRSINRRVEIVIEY